MKPASLVLLTLTLTLALLALPAPPTAAAQGDQGRIVFVSHRDGNDEIYVMNPDGSGVTRLTNNPATDSTPAWSPDNTRIAFSSDRDGSPAIYVMSADGSGVTRLTSNAAGDSEPAWSPDGTKIAFTRNFPIETSNSAIYVMNADGSGVTQLVSDPDMDYGPAWSPDGSKIAFCSYRDSVDMPTDNIYVVNADGSGITNLTSSFAANMSPAWSPDGSKIAFYSSRGGPNIYVMNSNGSRVTALTNNINTNDADGYPTWAPDGSRIAFSSYHPDHKTSLGTVYETDIFVMGADGSSRTNLTGRTDEDGSYPDWSHPAGAPTPIGDARTFPETGQSIAGRIRSYWEQNGGLPVFGFPITTQQAETIEGQSVQTQWFERNRLELHPENKVPYDVLLGRLGADRLAQRGYEWQSVPRETAQTGCRYFSETGRNVCGDILKAWRANGLNLDGKRGFSESENLALFGLPLTGLINETLSDGREYQVQYFERARFELHPENAPPYNVLLGLLGNEVRAAR
jgi:Tol biopolymer transport system component